MIEDVVLRTVTCLQCILCCGLQCNGRCCYGTEPVSRQPSIPTTSPSVFPIRPLEFTDSNLSFHNAPALPRHRMESSHSAHKRPAVSTITAGVTRIPARPHPRPATDFSPLR